MAELNPQETMKILKEWHEKLAKVDSLIHELHKDIQEVYKNAHESQ